MKILLVYTNRNQYLAPPPVGLAYLVSPLKKEGHQVAILDLMFSKQSREALHNSIESFKPELVGFSIRNLDNQCMLDLKNPLPEIKELVDMAKNKGVITVLGGTAFTTFPVEMLQFMKADYGISGQGEESFPLLIAMFDHKKDPTDVPGLVYWDNQTIRMNPPLIKGYAGNMSTDWTIMNLKPYRKAFVTPPAAVIVKTGCPYECSFCEKTTMGKKFVLREIDQIIADIQSIQKTHKARSFFLIDPCFNSPLDFAKELLHEIIQTNLKIRFITPLVPVHQSFDDEFFDLFHKAGGYFTMAGMDSFSEQMLANYRKPFYLEDVYKFGQLANKHRVKFGVEQIFGGPGETKETIEESMFFLSKIDYALYSYTIGIRIYPETALFETAKKEGLIKGSSELFFSRFYLSKDIDLQWAKEYIDHETKKYAYRYRKMASIGLRNTLERFLFFK